MQLRIPWITYILLFLLFPFSGGAQTFDIIYGDTINYVDAQGRKQGFFRNYWQNGDLKYEVYFENGEKEGLEISYYDAQDCIEYSNTFNAGKLDGPSVTFFP
ncbi:MAG: hypothetical protein ACHQK8_03265, partial [Bacteroidia bacterium]